MSRSTKGRSAGRSHRRAHGAGARRRPVPGLRPLRGCRRRLRRRQHPRHRLQLRDQALRQRDHLLDGQERRPQLSRLQAARRQSAGTASAVSAATTGGSPTARAASTSRAAPAPSAGRRSGSPTRSSNSSAEIPRLLGPRGGVLRRMGAVRGRPARLADAEGHAGAHGRDRPGRARGAAREGARRRGGGRADRPRHRDARLAWQRVARGALDLRPRTGASRRRRASLPCPRRRRSTRPRAPSASASASRRARGRAGRWSPASGIPGGREASLRASASRCRACTAAAAPPSAPATRRRPCPSPPRWPVAAACR